MPGMSRRLRTLIAAIGIAAFAWLLFAALERALSLAQRFMSLPEGLRWVIGGLLALMVVLGAAAAVWLLRPRKPRAPIIAPDRASLESRIAALRESDANVEELRSELDELDRRRLSSSIYLAVFGEISTGKSTLIAALVPGSTPASDVRGGTTREVTHYEGDAPTGEHWTVADVPGSAEAEGNDRERIAREEALRAHAVLYVCAGDLTRTQAAELRWLGDFGKPLLLVVNKVDQWTSGEREQLIARLRERSEGIPDAILPVSARHGDLGSLPDALRRLLAPGAAALEGQRENAVLAGLHERTSETEALWRAAEAERIVHRYARRAVVGAMAAVAPGTDLVIQGALAAGLVRALAGLYGVRVTEVEIEDLLRQVRLTLRTGTTVVLAVAGNAMKAFPGLGTLGGGVLHAFAYALIFDSLGRALAASLAERQALDQADAGARLHDLLADEGTSRLRRLAELTGEALRDR
jgi:GTP-binding protein EngB required for normal cell division/uncharacterized protein (DUF697 family)